MHYGLLLYQIKKLQHVHNAVARILCHWLQRNTSSQGTSFAYWVTWVQNSHHKILHDLAPNYLKNLITLYRPSRPLSSYDRNLLHKPYRLKTYGHRTFCGMPLTVLSKGLKPISLPFKCNATFYALLNWWKWHFSSQLLLLLILSP